MGGMARILRRMVPAALRAGVRRRLDELRRSLKEPRMIYGFRTPEGEWLAKTRISDTTLLYRPEGIRLGDDVFVWHYSILDGTAGLEIGEGSQIGMGVGIFTHGSHVAIRVYGRHYGEVPEAEKTVFQRAPVRIGRFVFVGAGAKVLPGVTVGDGALIAAGSIVSRDVPPFSLVAGNPARVIGDVREQDRKYLDDPQLRAWYEEWQSDGVDGPWRGT